MMTEQEIDLLLSDKNKVDKKGKRWAFLFSITFPPLGLICAARYFLGSEDDAHEAGWWCVGLTILSLVLFTIFFKLMLSSAGTSVDQINQIKPSDIEQLLQ